MAEKKAEEMEEYESDLDDTPLPAVRRRAAASDDDDDEGGGATGSSAPSSVASSDLDFDSDGQGAAEMYDDDEVYDEEGSEVCDEFEVGGGGVAVGEALEDEGKYGDEVADDLVAALEGKVNYGDEETYGVVAALEDEGKHGGEAEGKADVGAAVGGVEVVKKGSDAQAVPTKGAFYMHDDRDNRNGSQRKKFGDQKLWYPKDDSVWAHDRFYEMNFRNSPIDDERRPRSSFRAWDRGSTHGFDHGYLERTLTPSYDHDDREAYKYLPKESTTLYGNANNYRRVPSKFHTYYDHDDTNLGNVQRGSHTYYGNANGFNSEQDGYGGGVSRPYQPHWESAPLIYSGQNIRQVELHCLPAYSEHLPESNTMCQNEEGSFNAEGGRRPSQTLGFGTEQTVPWKQTYPSNVNAALPTSYHSRSSHQELPMIQRGKARSVMFSKLFTSSVRMAHSSLKSQSRPVYRVETVAPSGRENALDSLCTVATEDIDNPAVNTSASAFDDYIQYSKSSDQGTVYQERVSTQIFCPKPSSTTEIQSQAPSSDEDADTSMSAGSVTSLVSSAENEKLKNEKVDGASFTYDGGHVHGDIRASGLTLGDKCFTRPPAQLPALQFNGQHPGGPDAPFIGMTLPRFVAQQQLSISSEMSQMTWDHVTEAPVSQEIPDVLGRQLGQRQNRTRR
uniref:Btz domain-containing protein n=1 Tax=Leersia perrieri TaxID=77586 RepID=A0A0D9V509_9ORYZ